MVINKRKENNISLNAFVSSQGNREREREVAMDDNTASKGERQTREGKEE